ncbi:OmpH family outer membrane protein [Flavobacteriaceae bacterium GSB9]|nr:OmpH family outer membrane protein [Flavobacteriaceae bacterium GSB9]
MQNNVLFLLTFVFMLSFSTIQAQRGVRIAYIDTEYILENVPEYQEATQQLNAKAQEWKNEIQKKLAIVDQKRTALNNEKALLTTELIEERQEDIEFEEAEILDYQQKRFGPNGDLFIQKKQLMQPIQDQIFAAVQDLAEGRKYDFIFDKSSDATMLFSAKRFDLSEQVLRSINRTAKRKQVQNRAERKAAEEEELIPEVNEELDAREKALEEKKQARAEAVEKRRQEILAAREAKKKEAQERREKILAEREKARQAKLEARQQTTSSSTKSEENEDESVSEGKTYDETKTEVETKTDNETKTQAELIEENRQRKLAEREARKKELEERKQRILEERQRRRDSIIDARKN